MKFEEKDLVRIAKRENNKKRNYLVVNPLQGKHIPVAPHRAFEMFDALAELLRETYRGERLLLIGFAETATAIGARVALQLGCFYMQTTREVIPGVEYLFFSESHSHATEQKLVRNDLDRIVDQTDRMIFIEDEVTTGNTILNIVTLLEETYPGQLQFSVASLLNGMDKEHRKIYDDRNIPLHYLVKTNHSRYAEIADVYQENGSYKNCRVKQNEKTEQSEHYSCEIPGRLDARRLVGAEAYRVSCERLCKEISSRIPVQKEEKILVLGTEEFMYPALAVAEFLEQKGCNVRFHATTRSPIAVSADARYPLHTRYELVSLYDSERVTYLYDIGSYDQAVVITDAPGTQSLQDGAATLLRALEDHCPKISLVRWC